MAHATERERQKVLFRVKCLTLTPHGSIAEAGYRVHSRELSGVVSAIGWASVARPPVSVQLRTPPPGCVTIQRLTRIAVAMRLRLMKTGCCRYDG
jgi:hypothetical protein